MTYGDIIEWIEQEYDFERGEDVQEAFNTISEEWEGFNRDTLANTLGDNKGDVLEGIRQLIAGSDAEPETDKDVTDLEQRADTIESGIRELFTEFGQIIRSSASVVLPVGFTVQTEVIEPVGFVLNDTLQGCLTGFSGCRH